MRIVHGVYVCMSSDHFKLIDQTDTVAIVRVHGKSAPSGGVMVT